MSHIWVSGRIRNQIELTGFRDLPDSEQFRGIDFLISDKAYPPKLLNKHLKHGAILAKAMLVDDWVKVPVFDDPNTIHYPLEESLFKMQQCGASPPQCMLILSMAHTNDVKRRTIADLSSLWQSYGGTCVTLYSDVESSLRQIGEYVPVVYVNQVATLTTLPKVDAQLAIEMASEDLNFQDGNEFYLGLWLSMLSQGDFCSPYLVKKYGINEMAHAVREYLGTAQRDEILLIQGDGNNDK